MSEPANCREYVALHHRLGVDAGDRLLDIACGAGLALELARLRGASAAVVSRRSSGSPYRSRGSSPTLRSMHAL
ncbi:hypothetical protein [Kribbella sp. NPDC006257]|uniref:hypothetical protein n=1 Tax=Kribbella sp. NPDC006257 TaxID=3156738 RepID=UPI0033A3CB03